ncbi:MAG: efflux RND transporter periplasmic adaptor subunit [Deltaproteobacteria bacterium]|nr:efflux RND transporter periplasmic adaptor subunit [Deltaproteobacteria bacterium]
MRRNKLLTIPLAALIGLGVFILNGCGRGDGKDLLSLSGNVEVTEADIGFTMAGRISELLKEEGDRVEKGGRLASLQRVDIESEAAKAEAAVFEAGARLAELKAGPRPQELSEAEANVSFAYAELEKARKDLERYDLLFKNGAIAASQYDSYVKAFETSRARHKAAEERKSMVKEGPRREDIKAAEFRVRQSEAALSAINEKLKDTVIYAPFDGVVLKKMSETGETVGAGAPLYTIGGLDNPWVKVYVKEDKLGLVKLGQKAEVRTDSYPDKSYDGTVTFISSEAEFTPKSVQTKEERVKLVFGVKIRVDRANSELKPGMPADVRIFLK